MKYISILIITLSFAFLSCDKKTKDAVGENQVEAEVDTKSNKVKTTSSARIKDCDDFLDTFEVWTLDLISLMENHEGDPVGLAMDSAYTNTMIKGVDFMQDWDTISVSCATDSSYESRMKAIQENMEKRQKELGFK